MARSVNPRGLAEWAATFHGVVTKIAQGAKTPGCDIRLTQRECEVLAQALRLLSKKEEQ